MKVHRDMARLADEARGCAVAIGNFDGVHRGHRAVIDAARRHAASPDKLGVITFEPHPKEVVAPATAPRRLTPLRRKIELLRELGVGHLYLLRFDRRLMAMPAEAFIEEVLLGRLGIRALASGESFRFGRRRQGDTALLAAAAARHGFAYDAVPPLLDDGTACSSTRIRQALDQGDLGTANRLLGYPFIATGIVRRGDQRGRTIGFPTANLVPDPTRQALPAQGVYAVRAGVREKGRDGSVVWHPAIANLGRRPTFDGVRLLLEVHLFDAVPDLYDRRLDVAFIEWLRGETRFAGLDDLRAQIARDCAQARRIHDLAGARHPERHPTSPEAGLP